jgi:hypothetical protein
MLARLGLFALIFSLTSPPASAQEREDLPRWKIDPYTQNEAEAYQAAGYVRYHRVMLHEDLSVTEVMQVLGDLKMNWVETEHFVIGCDLPEYKIPGDKILKERLAEEYARLREKLPALPKKAPKKLDPWLRVHLYAQRCEDVYARLQKVLAVTDESFPAGRHEKVDGEYRGEGPYLGQRGKYVVLLTEKKSTLHRFANTWCDGNFQSESPIVHNFFQQWTLLYGTSPQLAEGYLGDDARLHANLIHGLVHAMLGGYKGYLHDLPVWLREGIAHCLVNEIEPRYHNFVQITDQFPNEKKLWVWEPRVRNLAKNEAALPFSVVSTWMTPDNFRIGHHLNLWSRVHYLMQTDPAKFASFVAKMKAPIKVPGGTSVSAEQVMERQAEAWKLIYDLEFAAFDEAWAEWVLDTYSKK